MTQQAEHWINPDTAVCRPDVVVFDVDGVLLDDSVSFRQAVIATVSHVTAHLGAPPITLDDVAAFKRAGGVNNDWDCAYVLAALVTAKYRDRSRMAEWPSLETLAAESGGGGVEWVRGRVPAQALPSYDVIRELLNEYYWGTDLLKERLGQTPRHLKSHRGYVRDEHWLVPPGFLDDLRARGVKRFGIVTGRNRAELAMGLETLGLTDDFECIVPTEEVEKPNPVALWRMVEALRPVSMAYVGDTRDDLDLVLSYRKEAGPSAPPALSVIVAPRPYWSYWRELGADAVVNETVALLRVLESLPLG